jgi:2-polyprenyl-6-methoxyphenol hydroxylase-like FAD-dependent oxidoreductase
VAVEAIELCATTCLVSFSEGSTSTYDIVIGADGIGSSVRGMVFPEVHPTYVGNVSWRFITRNTTAIESWTAMLGRRKALLAIPVSATDVYVYADSALAIEDVDQSTAQASLPALFSDFCGPILPLITDKPADTHVHFSKIEQVVIGDWVKGRVVLIGDAAHAASPSMAQNAGMALEDALVLAQSIDTAASPDIALATYNAKRRHRVDWTQKQCEARDKMRTWPTPIRDAVLKVLGNRLYARSYLPLAAPFE